MSALPAKPTCAVCGKQPRVYSLRETVGRYRVRYSAKYKGQTFEGPCCWAHQIEQAGRKP